MEGWSGGRTKLGARYVATIDGLDNRALGASHVELSQWASSHPQSRTYTPRRRSIVLVLSYLNCPLALVALLEVDVWISPLSIGKESAHTNHVTPFQCCGASARKMKAREVREKRSTIESKYELDGDAAEDSSVR